MFVGRTLPVDELRLRSASDPPTTVIRLLPP